MYSFFLYIKHIYILFTFIFSLAKNYGLELKMNMNFKEYFDKHLNSNRGLLNHIQALEVFNLKNILEIGSNKILTLLPILIKLLICFVNIRLS